MEGKVKWFSNAKGYGFIEAEDKDYFVHFSQIKGEGYKTLEADQKVSFDVEDTGKGLQAKDVEKI